MTKRLYSSLIGNLMSTCTWNGSGLKYKDGFNGKEKDDDINVSGGDYDFGARIYDSRLGRWLALDDFMVKYPNMSPFSMCANNPISIADISGDSLYILFYVSGNDDPADDEMFKAAAYTRKTDIERSAGFDATRDKVVVLVVQDISDIKTLTEETVAENIATYGGTVEFDVWSHAGTDGPIGSVPTSVNPLEEGSNLMSLAGWGGINFNWANNGTGCRSGFFGCRTGVDPTGIKASFSTEISALSDFKNVTVAGQTASTYPSKYTNYRENSQNGEGNFIDKEENGMIIFYRTYWVGGVKRSEDWNLDEQNDAKPMRLSVNGKGNIGGFQSGDKKKN